MYLGHNLLISAAMKHIPQEKEVSHQKLSILARLMVMRRGGRMQEQMEREDEDGLAVDLDSDEDAAEHDDEEDDEEDDDDENDEDVPIPDSWNLDMSTVMTVNDGHESSWEYHMNNVEIGSQYSTKQALREAVTKWTLTTQRIYQTDVSNKQ